MQNKRVLISKLSRPGENSLESFYGKMAQSKVTVTWKLPPLPPWMKNFLLAIFYSKQTYEVESLLIKTIFQIFIQYFEDRILDNRWKNTVFMHYFFSELAKTWHFVKPWLNDAINEIIIFHLLQNKVSW